MSPEGVTRLACIVGQVIGEGKKNTQRNTNRTAIRLDIHRYNLPTFKILQCPRKE